MTDEAEARLRLGAWLAAEPGRTWDDKVEQDTYRGRTVAHHVALYPSGGPVTRYDGSGPTLAEAILAALDSVNQNDEPNGYDDVTRDDFARDEWTR